MNSTPHKEKLSKEQAAYRLGLLSRTYPIARDLFLEKPEAEWGTAARVLLTIEQLREALLSLSPEIPQAVYGEFKTWITKQHEHWTAVFNDVTAYCHIDEHPWPKKLVAQSASDLDPGVNELADLASERLGCYRSWFDLGAAIGDYRLKIQHIEDPARLPDLGDIVTNARAILSQSRHVPRLLQSLETLGNKSSVKKPHRLLIGVLQSIGLKNGVWNAMGDDAGAVRQLILALDCEIQRDIHELTEKAEEIETLEEGKTQNAEPSVGIVDTPERMVFDNATMTITLDGEAFLIKEPAAFQIVKLLWGRLGDRTYGKLIRESVDGLWANNAISEKLKTLPKKVRACVTSNTKKGYWIVLPQIAKSGGIRT